MRAGYLILSGCLIACTSLSAFAQTSVDRSFTTTSKDCAGVQWSEATLKSYPKIAAACQGVQEREGKSYVKFQGTVTRNARRGKELEVDFKDAGEITLTPPADAAVYMNGRRTPVADLQRGDALNFYVAEDRLAAQFYAENQTPATTTTYVLVPFQYREHPVAGAPEQRERVASALPSTASELPLLALFGILMVALGAGLTIYRVRRQ